MIPLSHLLTVSIGLFAIGLFGALSRRNAIGILMAIELILNAAALAFVAFNAYGIPAADRDAALGQTAALFIIGIAAAGAIVGLALVLAVYRHQRTIFADDMHLLKG
ncbi:MAG: NADH-quinone oxidoreductase subunit K [Omnitrophica WOR_2 bacterium RIFCSPHIGHO2_02_FULL_68_15]|nr:MAG: NADH-quinone oxidoreductase subunit K [Omnitrophica WOR_2 bacterium RIFCSPHIGHO2_02_FULL_68_15]